MQAIRSPAVAGSFYPANSQELSQVVDRLLDDAASDDPAPKVIVAPHAGFVYSGPIAASVYQRLRNRRHDISRVVLLGPSHRVGFRGIAATSASAYETPLGKIPIAAEAVSKVIGMPETGFLDEAHAQEHSLEVHLPFLQRTLGQFDLVPLVVGDADRTIVARVLDALWGGPETLIVISSDLSHYHDYATARQMDDQTSRKITSLSGTLSGEEACGCRPLNGLLQLASERGLVVEQVDVRNSGDTAGARDRVVGYGAFVITNTDPSRGERALDEPEFDLATRQQMLAIARQSISAPLIQGGGNFEINLKHFPASLLEHRATFVTLNIAGQLRGCIGSLVAHRPLIVDVANNAQTAAFKDPRFKALTLPEFMGVDIHISVLTVPERIEVDDRASLISALRVGTDGLIIEEGSHRATYLPSVWTQLPDPEQFVSELRRKAGLPGDGWSTATRVLRYQTEEFC
ncbi:MAG: AmmeMemoRadiSam system protein B [Proteobacteria bacterium]|nr:AmmeMemoRadiSam system protein B [Pseudomonadota bacterium]